jgi:hypothetical protein
MKEANLKRQHTVVPAKSRSGKGKTMELAKRSVVTKGSGEAEGHESASIGLLRVMTLFHVVPVTMGTCHHTLYICV